MCVEKAGERLEFSSTKQNQMVQYTWKIDEPQISKHFHSWLIIRTENELMWVLETINFQNIYLVINETVVLRDCQCQWESCLYTHSISPGSRKTFSNGNMTSLHLHCLVKLLCKIVPTHTYTLEIASVVSLQVLFFHKQHLAYVASLLNDSQLANDKINSSSRQSYMIIE